MEKTEKFFIFTWKELIVIILLVLTLLGFFFTLGLHYGKKISPPAEHAQANEEGGKLEESPESLPSHEALEEGSQHAKAVSSDTLKEATKDEVAKSDVKIDLPKAVSLPTEKAESKAEKVVAKLVEKTSEKAEEKSKEKAEEKTEVKSESKVAFFVQLGSFVSKKEAQQKVKAFGKKGVHTEIHTAEVNNQTRYRVVIPGFKTKASADQHGKELKHKHKIENFVVIK